MAVGTHFKTRRVMDKLIEAMPVEFDAHRAQRWYSENLPEQFHDDLAQYQTTRGFTIQLSIEIGKRTDLVAISDKVSVNIKGEKSNRCTQWRRLGT